MMKLFHFHDPCDFRFASASRRGTWQPSPGSGLCTECGTSRQHRIPPLIIEWEPGSELIGDFTWPGFDDEVMVTERAKTCLLERCQSFEFHPILMWQNVKLKRPKHLTRRTKPRVWLPYEGQTLWEMQVTAWYHLDLERSGLTFAKECSICRKKIYKRPSVDKRRIVINSSNWNQAEIFHIYEYPRWIFCTEHIKNHLERANVTNVGFLEDGAIFSD